MNFNFDNTYIKLPSNFYSELTPIPVAEPELVLFNQDLAQVLGFENNISKQIIAEYLSGNKIFPAAAPIALAYAGHQFGHFVPSLGDGRAILLGEIIAKDSHHYDIQLKGSGATPYSRRGDGRAALGPILREYIVSEAMHALGIKTTRSLAVVTTGELVMREQPLPGAVLTRIASSHIRIGTFEYFAARQDFKSLKIIADYAIARHYPELLHSKQRYQDFLLEVAKNQALLIADWMSVGFIHGVMNTDNMAISGETIDYGPCAFLDEYVPNKVFSSIDYYGRYAFNNQPNIALWNLLQLHGTLAFLLEQEQSAPLMVAENLEQHFIKVYSEAHQNKMCQKIGIFGPEKEDLHLLQNLLNIMSQEKLDYTLTFRYLTKKVSDNLWQEDFFSKCIPLQEWLLIWRQHLKKQKLPTQEIAQKMQNINPIFIPRNHQIQKAIEEATNNNNFSSTNNLINTLKTPNQEKPEFKDLILPPKSHEIIQQTFCGT